MPSVSAIITCYNVMEYVAVAMQSILDTKIDDLQLIVIDDCSTDRTRDIIDIVVANNPEVTCDLLYFPKNTIGGVASAANAGLDIATGDIVVFIDGDDWVIPHALERALDHHIATSPDFTVCNCSEYWNDSGEYSQYPEAEHWHAIPNMIDLEQKRRALLKMAPFPWRKIYSRAFLEQNNVRFPVGDFFFEDNPFHWTTTTKAKKIEFFDEVTHVHRMARSGQTVNAAKGTKFLKIFDHADIIREELKAEARLDAHHMNYLDWLFKHIIWCGNNVPAGFLNEVFERSKSRVAALPPDVFWHALAVSGFEATDVRKMAAIYLDERFEFLREF